MKPQDEERLRRMYLFAKDAAFIAEGITLERLTADYPRRLPRLGIKGGSRSGNLCLVVTNLFHTTGFQLKSRVHI
jgi:hypothetical protein